MADSRDTPRLTQRPSAKENTDAIASAFLAFAEMMEEDYGISKAVAVKTLALAYDSNARKP